MPTISLATVYNCLDTLVQCGLIKQVNFVRESTRYCPNLHEHAHFHDEKTGEIHDVEISADLTARLRAVLPSGYSARHIDLSFAAQSKAEPAPTTPTRSVSRQLLCQISHQMSQLIIQDLHVSIVTNRWSMASP